MYYCLVICQVSSTDRIYHRAGKRRGDKDRLMHAGYSEARNGAQYKERH